MFNLWMISAVSLCDWREEKLQLFLFSLSFWPSEYFLCNSEYFLCNWEYFLCNSVSVWGCFIRRSPPGLFSSWTASFSGSETQTAEACQVCLESVNCQIFHILQVKDSSQCFSSGKYGNCKCFLSRQRITASSHSHFNCFWWIKSAKCLIDRSRASGSILFSSPLSWSLLWDSRWKSHLRFGKLSFPHKWVLISWVWDQRGEERVQEFTSASSLLLSESESEWN